MTKFLILSALAFVQIGCALLRSAEDEQRIASNKRYMQEREEDRRAEEKRQQEKAAQAEADRLVQQKYLEETPPDERMLEAICETANDVFKFALELDDEQRIARGSGSYDLSAANELGFKVLTLQKTLSGQTAQFKQAFKRAPDINRCTYVDGLSKVDLTRAVKVIRRFDSK